MGFFGKIKQWMGIGGVKVLCQPHMTAINRGGGTITGTLQLTSKSDQEVLGVMVRVTEYVHTGKGEKRRTKEFELGQSVISGGFMLKAGETKSFEFQVGHAGGQTLSDMAQSKGGAMKVLGKIGAMASDEEMEYRVRGEAKVKGRLVAATHDIKLRPA